jgi:hypothetical protein
MKFRETIKFGFGAYIGWEIARCLDKIFGKKLEDSLSKNKEKMDDEQETD